MKKIYVGNLPFSLREEELLAKFAAYGEVAEGWIMRDGETGQPRGFGFIKMSNDRQAETAIAALNGAMIHGRLIVVDEARPHRERKKDKRFREAAG